MPFIADSISLGSKAPDDNTSWELGTDDNGNVWECEFCENTGWWIFRNHRTGAERFQECSECGNPYDLPQP